MPEITQKKYLIIGAGPAGMAAGIELAKQGCVNDLLIVDKDESVGGLSKTYKIVHHGEVFLTDNGPHRFFSKNQYLYDFIGDLLGDDWITVKRQTRQFIDGKFYDYPINATQALRNFGLIKATRILIDYFIAQIKYKILRKKVNNFYDYIVANFGKTLGEFSMINYTEKIWGIPSNTIHIDWAKQRIKGLNLFSIVLNVCKKFFHLSSHKPKSLVDTFYYPKHGTGMIYEKITDKLRDAGGQFLLQTRPMVIKHQQSRITEVVLHGKDGDCVVHPEYLIESMPMEELVALLEPAAPAHILQYAKRLRYRSQVYLFVTLNKDSITADQWLYFPDQSIPFGRVSEMKNFSKDMSPKGKTSLFIEFFCFANDEIWQSTAKELFELVMPIFAKMNFFQRDEVIGYDIIRKNKVYPIYDLEYKTYVEAVKKYLDSFHNLYYIGRPGRFRYNNQDHSLEMGIMAARSIVSGKKFNMDDVGSQSEYFEKGSVPTKI